MIFEPFEILTLLHAAGVEHVVVGGMAGLLHRSSVLTQDLDIVHRRTPENVARLMAVVEQMDAFFRNDLARRKLRPRASDFAGRGQILLMTPHGKFDVLCEVGEGGGLGYEELLPRSIEMEERGLRLRVLDLPALIRLKTEAGRPKDKLAVPVLIAALEERNRRG